MAKITPHLRRGAARDGLCPIYIRISHKTKEAFVSLGFKAREKDWNARTNRLRKSYAGFYEANIGFRCVRAVGGSSGSTRVKKESN